MRPLRRQPCCLLRRLSTYRPLWVAACALNCGFSYFWDVERDWEISWFTNTQGAPLPTAPHPHRKETICGVRMQFDILQALPGAWAYRSLLVAACLLNHVCVCSVNSS